MRVSCVTYVTTRFNHNGLHTTTLVELRVQYLNASARRRLSQWLALCNSCRWLSQQFACRNTCRRLSQQFGHRNSCGQLSQRFARRNTCTPKYFSTAILTLCALQHSLNSASDGSMLPLINRYHDGLHITMLVE